jgi:hypothetical protein
VDTLVKLLNTDTANGLTSEQVKKNYINDDDEIGFRYMRRDAGTIIKSSSSSTVFRSETPIYLPHPPLFLFFPLW